MGNLVAITAIYLHIVGRGDVYFAIVIVTSTFFTGIIWFTIDANSVLSRRCILIYGFIFVVTMGLSNNKNSYNYGLVHTQSGSRNFRNIFDSKWS